MGSQFSVRCLPETCKCECDQTCKENFLFGDGTDEHFAEVSSYSVFVIDPVTEAVRQRWQSPNDQFIESMRCLPEEGMSVDHWPNYDLEPSGMHHLTNDYFPGRRRPSPERQISKIHNEGVSQLTGRYMSKEAGTGWPIYNFELPHVANLIGMGSPSAVRHESLGVSATEQVPNLSGFQLPHVANLIGVGSPSAVRHESPSVSSKERELGATSFRLPHVANLIGGGSPRAVRHESPGASAKERMPKGRVVQKTLTDRNNIPAINLPDRDKEEAAKRELQHTGKAATPEKSSPVLVTPVLQGSDKKEIGKRERQHTGKATASEKSSPVVVTPVLQGSDKEEATKQERQHTGKAMDPEKSSPVVVKSPVVQGSDKEEAAKREGRHPGKAAAPEASSPVVVKSPVLQGKSDLVPPSLRKFTLAKQGKQVEPGKMRENLMDTDPLRKTCDPKSLVTQSPVGQLKNQPSAAGFKPDIRL